MKFAAWVIISRLLFLAAFGVGAIALQIFLSKRNNKWLGLILPFIAFGASTSAILGNALNVSETPVFSFVLTLIPALLFANIPTGILLALYFAYQEKQKRQRALAKMSAQDLQ
ncbi:MAG: hypothetical protein LBT22_00025 [Peptococcaceae bacterium]|jgi:hypothetical protein|nr:hypothetical protein [Peptococcaceae bacterium]